jgi:FKBP-type peptidyl-prolyl cis-trans isomerase SlyD
MQFEAGSEEQRFIVTITNIGTETVTVDGNHPLAGVELNFDVELLDVREATEEELAHGHVHGPGGHHH